MMNEDYEPLLDPEREPSETEYVIENNDGNRRGTPSENEHDSSRENSNGNSEPDNSCDETDSDQHSETDSDFKVKKRPYLAVEKEHKSIDFDDEPYFLYINEEMARTAAKYFRCVECNYFKEDPDHAPLCLCGGRKKFHAIFIDPCRNEREWKEDCLETLPHTNAVGQICFDLAEAADNVSSYVRVSINDNFQHIMEFIKSFWKILQPTRPKLCISILTSSLIRRMPEDIKRKLISEVIDTLRACDSLLINNGLNNTTFNYMIGKSLAKLTTSYFGDDMAFVCPKMIGVTPWGCVAGRHMLVDVDHKFKRTNYKNVKSADESRVPLLPFNTAFLFGDDGYRGNYTSFAKSKFRALFEKKIASAKSANGLSVPVVDMIVRGDFNTLIEAANAVAQDISLIICKGTGGLADLLVSIYDQKSNFKDAQQKVDKTLELIVGNTIGAQYVNEAPQYLNIIFSRRDLITIYDVTGEKSLRSELMSSIMIHASDTLGKLYLTLSWRNYELANSVTLKTLEDIEPRSLYNLTLTALLNDELEFVKLFMRLGVQLNDFLTVDVLHSLYNFSRNRKTFLTNLNNGRCAHIYSHWPTPSHDKLEKNASLAKQKPGERGGFLQTAFTSFLGHIADKKVQSYMDALCEEEETRLMRADQKTVYLAAVHSLIEYNFRCEVYYRDTPTKFNRSVLSQIRIDEPADHLAIWAMLHGRQAMVRYFIRQSMHPVYLSIFTAATYRRFASLIASYDVKTMETYLSNADEVEADGLQILDVCESKSSLTTKAILLEYKPFWASQPATVAAAMSNSFKIISSSSFQSLVTETWSNGLKDNIVIVLLTIICPFILLLPNYTVNHPLKMLIDGSKPHEVRENTVYKPNDYLNLLPLTNRERIYVFYTSPMTNFAFTLIALLVFLLVFTYFLLFDLHDSYISASELIVIIYSISWMIENIITCVGEHLQTIYDFFALFQTYPWLSVYIVGDILFLVAVFSRISRDAFMVSVAAYSLQLIFNTCKLLYLMMLSPRYGPQVVMIKEMLKKLIVLLVILFIITLAYGVAVQVLLFPTIDDFSMEMIVNIVSYPYFQLFGELSFEYFYAQEECNSTTTKNCPEFNVIVPILHASYMLIAALIFLNLLIAIFSQVFSDLLQKSREIWMQNRFSVVFYFTRVSYLPPPFSGIAMFCIAIYKRMRNCCKPKEPKKKHKKKPEPKDLRLLPPTWEDDQVKWSRPPKTKMEEIYEAFLYRFQEYCREEHYRKIEESDAALFDCKLSEISKKLEDLRRRQVGLSTILPNHIKKLEDKSKRTSTKKTPEEHLREIHDLLTAGVQRFEYLKLKALEVQKITAAKPDLEIKADKEQQLLEVPKEGAEEVKDELESEDRNEESRALPDEPQVSENVQEPESEETENPR